MNDDAPEVHGVGLPELGDAIGELQDAQLAERNDLAEVRSRLLSRPLRRSTFRWAWVAAPVAAIAALAVWWSRPAPDLRFAVDGESGAAGGWVSTEETPQTLAFSDGSEVELAANSGVRVAELDEDGAQLDLQRGSMHVHVVHRDADTDWQVRAGPFTVEVVGTAFDVAWDPSQQRFALHLEEGRVRVAGPTVEERVVEVGETLSVELERQRMQVVLQIPDEEPAQQAPLVDDSDPREQVETPPPRRPRSQQLRIDWRQLARQARHREAVTAANWDREMATATAGDLLLLGDAARLGGEPTRARIAYVGVRERFPNAPEAAQAAFLLGRLAMRNGDPGSAAAWFERAISEDSDGPYAMVARGRLIDAYRRASNEVAAARSAREYLAAHPTGPHAALARSFSVEAE